MGLPTTPHTQKAVLKTAFKRGFPLGYDCDNDYGHGHGQNYGYGYGYNDGYSASTFREHATAATETFQRADKEASKRERVGVTTAPPNVYESLHLECPTRRKQPNKLK